VVEALANAPGWRPFRLGRVPPLTAGGAGARAVISGTLPGLSGLAFHFVSEQVCLARRFPRVLGGVQAVQDPGWHPVGGDVKQCP
jgi:hypothetical protein